MDKHEALDYLLRLRNEVLTGKDILPAINYGAVDVAVECIEMEIARAEHRSADVIRALNGLESCMARPGSCHQCDYYPDNECTETLLRDVRALIEGDASRLLTHDELEAIGETTTVYVEYRTKTFYNDVAFVNCKVYMEYDNFHGAKSCAFQLQKKKYGKEWRCWTSEPTGAQRKAVKWET